MYLPWKLHQYGHGVYTLLTIRQSVNLPEFRVFVETKWMTPDP